MKSRLSILMVTGLLLLVGAVVAWPGQENVTLEATGGLTQTSVKIGDKIFQVEIARTADEQAQGLSGRERLDTDRGLLFPFVPPQQPSFWMREMRFSIDIVWIADGLIADISPDLPVPSPGTSPEDLPLYEPSGLVDFALELVAGQASAFRIGQPVTIIETAGS